jgi:hypothetical protein
MRFTDQAQLACDEHLNHWLHLADEPIRQRALQRLLAAWDAILAEELGEQVADDLGRLMILDTALDDLQGRVDRELAVPLH